MTARPLKSRRLYVKFFVAECLRGSIRVDLKPDERGVWYDLCILAGESRVPGLIQAGHGQPYTHSYLAGMLNIPPALLERTLVKCIDEGRITESDLGIKITNWKAYQESRDLYLPRLRDKCALGRPAEDSNDGKGGNQE